MSIGDQLQYENITINRFGIVVDESFTIKKADAVIEQIVIEIIIQVLEEAHVHTFQPYEHCGQISLSVLQNIFRMKKLFTMNYF